MKGFKVSPIHVPPIKKMRTKTVKHTASFFTLLGGVSHFTPLHYMEAIFFTVAGMLSIYEPYLVQEAGEVISSV